MPEDNLPGRSSLGGAGRRLDRRSFHKRNRQRQALDLWIGGKSYVQIKNAMGLKSVAAARDLVGEGEDVWMEEEGGHVNRFRAKMRADLLELQDLMMEAVRGGDQMAVDRVLKVMERMARLVGTDAERGGESGAGMVIVTDMDTAMKMAGHKDESVEAEWEDVKQLEEGDRG